MEKEKKLKQSQKLALERINRLFEIATKMHAGKRIDKKKYVKRYLSLAKRIGEKTNVSIPKEFKKQYCKKCFSMNITIKEEKEIVIVKCSDCGLEKKFSRQ